MHDVLNRNLYLVKEHVGMFKAANNFDVYDPESGEIILECREDNLGTFTKMLRFTDYKRMTPFDIQIRTPSGEQVIRISRGVSLFLSTVSVFDKNDNYIGGFKQKFFSIGGAFRVLGPDEGPLCELKGKWTGWNFHFMKDDVEFAHVSKKWSGMGKELFTSADNYVLEMFDTIPQDNPLRQLIMAAVMCIDMVLKE
ncbi:phospholipid scramblase-related protein [Gimesia panareensis]|uniref:Scramblase n=1 Tax=Gimesia panareensis TaxID=2527978 RepID=A0A517Q003_9PLAN|nr:phospholipid scramblase-related protein [Gimesia panareensis]QDT24955.1 Scramblase [Gimesia panareensis]QDU47951.1 Scramblase [Gimesia panareensis]